MAKADWQKIEEIFGRAIELPQAERNAYLAEACQSDEELRDEIEKLLAADDQAGDFISEAVFASPLFEDISDELERAGPPTLIGKTVGKYRIIKELGRGGMGAVYLAERDDHEFKKRVAIKLIKRGMDTDFILKRFRHERQILATLEHANIAHLLDGGTTEDGLPFFVMEFIEGQTIDRFCAAKKLSVNDRLKIFLEVCSAVEYAHQNSIIHRDLKPGNILVTNDGIPKLLDFGIAKILDPDFASDTIEPTASIFRMMTPEYSSPEQIRGEPLTPASDIYSLGVLLFELLTGSRPYKFPSRAPHEIARVICEEQPGAPSESKPKPLRGKPAHGAGEIGKDLDKVVLKALQKNTADRYASIEEFSEDIKRYLDGSPVSASVFVPITGDQPLHVSTEVTPKPATTGEVAKPGWFGRGRAAVFAMILFAVLAVSASVYFYRTKTDAWPAAIDSIAVLPFRNTGGGDLEYLSDGIAESLTNSLSQLKGIKVIARSSVIRYKGYEADPQTVAKEMGVRAVVTGEIIQRGDSLVINAELVDASDNRRLWGEQYNRKVTDLVTIQEDIARQMSRKLKATLTKTEEDRVTKSSTQDPDAYQAYLKGRYYWNKRTKEANKTAVDFFRQAIAKDPGFALAYAGLADCYIVASGYQFMEPKEALDQAEDAVKEALKLDDKLGEAHASHAYIEGFGFGHYEEAGREFETAVELSPNYATAHQWYSMFLAAMGRRDEAMREIRTALDLDPLSLIINTDAALVYYYTREPALALEQCKKVRELEPKFWIIQAYEGLVYQQQGDYDKAIANWEALLKREPGFTSLIASLGHAYAKAGRPSDAKRMLAELDKLASPEKSVAKEKAIIYAGLGDKEKAFDELESITGKDIGNDIFFKAEPRADDLRSDPRFAALTTRMGFPQY